MKIEVIGKAAGVWSASTFVAADKGVLYVPTQKSLYAYKTTGDN